MSFFRSPEAMETAKEVRSPEATRALAVRSIEIEIAGLRKLADSIDGAFQAAIDMLSHVTGRVVHTGMGKSGHIARKIAATMASTGTPSFFVHPGEASHGDLGMIVPGDAVIAYSNSGNTPELGDIVSHCKRFDIPLIGVTSNPASVLAEESTVALLLPKAEEACPLGLAPTTSTTMTLALGDALAICLFQREGFSSDHFKTFHPGGSLGQKLLRIKDIMLPASRLPLVGPDTPMNRVVLTMTEHSSGCAVVVGEGRVMGIITDGDLRRSMSETLFAKPAGEVMTRKPMVVPPKMLGAEALRIMNERRITTLLVVDGNQLLGLVHMHDLLRAGIA